MSRINTQIYEEASEWIVRHRSDDLDADAKRRFDAWMRESPHHVRAYLEMSAIWEDLPALDPTWNLSADELIARARVESNVVPLDESHSETVRARNAIEPAPGPTRKPLPVLSRPASRSAFRRYAAAATVLLSVAAIATAWLWTQRGLYTTGIGEQRTIALLDGSTIQLNAQSRMRVHYTDVERSIDLLVGQALFKVAKDPNRPFVVDSDGTRVRAVGTQFDVYRKSTGIVVTVVEGRVAVAPPSSSIASAVKLESSGSGSAEPRDVPQSSDAHLTPKRGEVLVAAGEQILIAEAAPALTLTDPPGTSSREPAAPAPAAAAPKPANVEAATAWTQQRLIFDYTPLSQVAEEFNRYNHRPLVISDAALRDFNISGSFSSTDPTLLLRFLRDQPGIVVTETNDEIRISQKEG